MNIPNELSARFNTIEGRREIIQKYGDALNLYCGVNEDGEKVAMIISRQRGIEARTYQHNGFLRVNYYDTEGYAAGETFDGRWERNPEGALLDARKEPEQAQPVDAAEAKHIRRMKGAAYHLNALLNHTSKARCHYVVMDEEYISNLAYPDIARDMRGNRLIANDEYMIVTCPNGYKYYVNVSGDSALTACAETLGFISGKL